uniref:Retrotransposon protein, putative, Ty3-gypsy subclass n=2 Tax=Oryza sativa subsp. japonica TaxID=39947 RepID=Q53NY9_ORYSJ|nr:retrotransposon protein, putative, Ty3-gypsy sub-class [Oryza sativa Japonica Group]ABA92693.1 retrotransposon protein, putative, Ty3-gypsy subclass [Oryza sativa Japonica Group]
MAGQTAPTMADRAFCGRSNRTTDHRSDRAMGRHASPHIPNAYNDINRGYPPDTRYGQYNNIVPQQPPFRPPSLPPDPPRPETVEDWFRNTIRENFAKLRNRAREYQKPYPDFYDIIPYPRGYKIPEFTKFSGEDSRTTWEHIDQFLAQCGEANWDTCKLCLFSLSLSSTAFAWFTSLPAYSIFSLAQLEQKFHDYFHTSETELRLSDLTSVRHKYNESVADYTKRFRDIKSRCFSLKITDKDLANIAYDGLLGSIKERLNGQIFLDVDHVLHKALAQESRVDDNSLNASLNDSAISCIAKPINGSDCVNNLCNDAITIIAEPNVGSDCLASLDNDATTIMAEPSDGLDCVISLDNDGIAEPSDGSDCVSSLDNDIIEIIAELSDCSDYITSESEIALSPKTESQIGHVDVGKDDDNVLQDSGEIESKVAIHTYQRPYPEHIDSVPYPQGFEVPNFTKFTGEDARITMEHIGQFIEQCGKADSDDLLKLKLFPLSLSNFASTWYSLLAPNSISTWSQMEHEFHDYFKDASLMEQRPIDTSSVTCETISVTPMPKTGIVSNFLPISPIDVDKKKGKSVIIGDPRPKNRIKNAKAEDHKVAKNELSSIQRTKKPKLTFEMLMAKYKKGLPPPMPYYQEWKESPRSASSHSSNSRQDRFLQNNRSGGSKVKKVKKVWVRKEAKAPEVIAINEEYQDVHVPTRDAAKTIQAEKTKADAVVVDISGLTKPAGRSNRQTTASLTDPPGRKPILLGGQDINMLMKKSREMNGDGYNITSLSRRLLDAKASLDEIGKVIDQGRSDRQCTTGLTGGTVVEVNLGSFRYFKQDDLSVEDYKTLMGSNFEDVIDKRLKTLKEMKTLQDSVFREQLMGDSLKKYFLSIWQDA